MTDRKSARKPLPSQERLHELFRYDPETGLFTRKTKSARNRRIGELVGTKIPTSGYLTVRINKEGYLLHRLAWLIMTGEDPGVEKEVDHINGNRGDNSWNNLRIVSRKENGKNMQRKKNNSSGVTGVSWASDRRKWASYIMVNRKKINIGHFTELSEAIAARKYAEKLYGFHVNHDRVPLAIKDMKNPKEEARSKSCTACS